MVIKIGSVNKTRYVWTMVLIYILLLVGILTPDMKANQMFLPSQLNLKTSDIPSPVKAETNQVTIDATSNYKGMFTGGPYVSLNQGEYKVVISYQTDTPGNFIDFALADRAIDESVYQGQNRELDPNQNSLELSLKLVDNVVGFQVRSYYCGNGSLSIKGVEIKRDAVMWQDQIFLSVMLSVVFCFSLGYLSKRKYVFAKSRTKKNIFFGIAILLVFLNYPLLTNHITYSFDDILFHLNRIEGIKDGLIGGQFPVRVHPETGGYGYITPVMYPELLLYIPAVLRIFGVSMVVAYGFYLLLINCLTVFIGYFSFSRLLCSRLMGFWATVLYATGTYRLLCLPDRAALGEWTVIAFLPLAILGCYHLVWGNYRRWWYAVIGYTLVLQSHILTMLVLCCLTLIFILSTGKKIFSGERLISFLKFFGMLGLLNVWFIIPFLSMYSEDLYIKHAIFNINDFSLPLSAILSSYSSVANDGTNFLIMIESKTKLGLTFMLGVLFFCTAYSTLLKKHRNMGVISLVFGLGFLYIISNLFPWDVLVQSHIILKSLGMLQAPWRLLIFSSLFLSLAGGIGIVAFAKKYHIAPLFFCMIAFVCYFSAQPAIDRYMTDKPLLYNYQKFVPYANAVGWGEYYYHGTDMNALRVRNSMYSISNNSIHVSDFQKRGTRIVFSYEQDGSDGFVTVPLIAYPVYRAYDEAGNRVDLEKGENNLLQVKLPEQYGTITIDYGGRKLWTMATFVSIIAMGFSLWHGARKFIRGNKR